jgi:hypothetical protein
MLCDMDLGLRYILGNVFYEVCYLFQQCQKILPPFHIWSFIGEVEFQLFFMHKTLEALCTYGNARYLGYAWLIVCSFSKFVWSIGFAYGDFVFLVILEVYSLLLMHFVLVVSVDNFGMQGMQDK